MIGTRLRAKTHARVEALAIAEGRSLSGQVEAMIESLLGDTPPAEIQRRRGRPQLPAVDGNKYALGFKVSAAVKRALQEAAQRSGCTVSQEAEIRIGQSFDREATVVATLAALRHRKSG